MRPRVLPLFVLECTISRDDTACVRLRAVKLFAACRMGCKRAQDDNEPCDARTTPDVTKGHRSSMHGRAVEAYVNVNAWACDAN
mmetsp:Transcript_72868/g.121617  ORF Transcript_72868/g.121617 Transcript_72868/m.121617 type:complete len:84 (-) Transcript_72868:2994-3245(-)